MAHSKIIDEIVDELFEELFPEQDNIYYGKFVDSNKPIKIIYDKAEHIEIEMNGRTYWLPISKGE